MRKSTLTRAMAMIVFVLSYAVIAQSIVGSSTMELNSPVTPAIKAQMRTEAIDSLTNYLGEWINNFLDGSYNNTNSISKYFLKKFSLLCGQHAKEQSKFNNRELTLTLSLPDHIVDSLLSTFNRHYDSLAVYYWRMTEDAQLVDNKVKIFDAAMKCLFYSSAHIGTPIIIPGLQQQVRLKPRVKLLVQSLINKTDMSFTDPIITGKPPNPPEKNVSIIVELDSVPFPDLPLILSLANKRTVVTLQTDAQGEANLNEMRTPFVLHGAFLHIRPNFSALIDPSFSFVAEDFDLTLSNTCDQTLIFNIVKPTFTLDYSATSVSQIEVPLDFSSKTVMQQFLRDSCSLQPSIGDVNPEITVNIQCQVSSYAHDDQEKTQLKAEAQITIAETKKGGSIVTKTGILNEKTYDANLMLMQQEDKKKKKRKRGTPTKRLPIGLFFWESLNSLKLLVYDALHEL